MSSNLNQRLLRTKPLRAFQDYRVFLRDFVEASREAKPRWSYASWARKLGLKSKSTLIMTIQGKRHLSPKLMQQMIQYFKFTSDEESYFRRLVSIESKEKTVVHQVVIGENLEKTSPIPPESEAAIIKEGWLSYVIKESASALGSNATPEKIANSICSKPSSSQVEELLRCLVETGYLLRQTTESGELAYIPVAQAPQLGWTKAAGEKVLSDGLKACEQAGKSADPEHRVLQTSFVRIRRERVPEARILLRSFQKEFMRELEEDGGNEIMQLNLHLFPVTTGLKD
jgi:uncharacterized protein (TIGR02147 family)